jgi:hypothetical protein
MSQSYLKITSKRAHGVKKLYVVSVAMPLLKLKKRQDARIKGMIIRQVCHETTSYFENSKGSRQDSTTQEQIIDLSYDGEFWCKNDVRNDIFIYNIRGLGNPMLQSKGIEVNLFV